SQYTETWQHHTLSSELCVAKGAGDPPGRRAGDAPIRLYGLHVRGDGRGLKAFDDEVDAQRKLPHRDRDCEEQRRRGDWSPEAEQRADVANDEQGRSAECEQG